MKLFSILGLLTTLLSTAVSAKTVTHKNCKTNLQRFCAIACAGGGLVPKICSGSMKRVGPLTVEVSFDPKTGSGSGLGSLHNLGMDLKEDFKLACVVSKANTGYIDCVSDLGLLGIGDKKLVLRTRAQPLKDGSYYYWVGAPGEMKWLGAFHTSKACLP